MRASHLPAVLFGCTLWLAFGGGVSAIHGEENLLTNPNLAEGILAPKGWSFNAAAGNRVEWQVSPGGRSHAVVIEGSGRDWAGLTSRRVAIDGGEQVTVGAWMRALSGDLPSAADRLFVRAFRRGQFIGQDGPSLAAVGSPWQWVTGAITVPESADSVDVSFQLRSKARVQIVSVCLLRGDQRRTVKGALPPPPREVTAWETVRAAQNLPPDTNDNGLADALEAFLGVRPDDRAVSLRRTRRKTTSLQTSTGYRDDNDVKVDIVIVAGNEEQKIRSWAALGYEPHVMVGFRAGPDYLDGHFDGRPHRDEVQTSAQGKLLTCGPGSYYMTPTENRRRIFRRYFADAVTRGAKAVCPEEPEFFSWAGYSDAFRKEWETFYGEPWQDPSRSVQARFRSARLKSHLERRLLQACYAGARSVDAKAPRFLLAHSPLNYTVWGIVFGHHETIASGDVDAMIAQVWTGTARTPVTAEGVREERTFENAFLEYGSCVGLTRGLGIDLWFLMDPLEDNPDRTMEDYRRNYYRTLAAALMFPQVDRYEVMPWPARIFGRVPADFATEICGVVQLLSDMQNQRGFRFQGGVQGIGTFLADSAMWQRGAPHASDVNAFYGLALPLLMRGIPVGVPSLDRAAEAGYLDPYRVLLLSYDLMKPMDPAIHESLAGWVRDGGCLLVFGGDDPYNDVDEWWKLKGFLGPTDHLLSQCGFDVSRRRVRSRHGTDARWTIVAKTDYTGRERKNQTVVDMDLTPLLAQGAVLVKCEDSIKEDGWGALITRMTVEGQRDGRPFRREIRPGTDDERQLIAWDSGSQLNPEGFRFCDRNASVVYRFEFDPGAKTRLQIELGNQYLVSAAPTTPGRGELFRDVDGSRALGVRDVQVPPSTSIVSYLQSGARSLYAAGELNLLAETQVGKGSVLFCGVSPAWFSQSPQSSQRLRELVRYAMEKKVGATYRESGSMKLRRGRCLIAKTFDQELVLRGDYLNVLAADLPVVHEVRLPPDEVAVLYDVSGELSRQVPALLFSSSCVEWKDETRDRLRLILSGPSGVFGACRIHTGGRSLASVQAMTWDGSPASIGATAQGNTLLLRHPNQPLGLAVDVRWAD